MSVSATAAPTSIAPVIENVRNSAIRVEKMPNINQPLDRKIVAPPNNNGTVNIVIDAAP